MTAKHSASPTSYRAFSHSLGHEDAFPRPRLSARCRFSQRTFAGTWGNGRDAPTTAIRPASIELVKPTQAVRKLARSICSQKVLLNLVNLKTKSAGDGYPKKAIEKTVLRFLGSRTFSHGLGQEEPFRMRS